MSARGKDWCILRTGPARTLKLTASLQAAGIEAWTPVRTVKRRVLRGKKTTEKHEVALTPTFVFARAAALDDLRRIISDPLSAHPAFSLFRYYGRVPLLADGEVERLRLAERRSTPRELRATYAPGAIVRPSDGAYAGMSGVVRASDGRYTLVAFGGWMNVKIETFAIRSGDVDSCSLPGPEEAISGIAA